MQKNNSISKGSALLSALFIMTLVAIAAIAMTTRLQLDIYRTRLTIVSDKLTLASQAVTFWAMSELTNKNQVTLSNRQGKLSDFPDKFSTIYPNALIRGSLYDLQARFNLNNLADKKYRFLFFKLIENTVKNLPPATHRILVLALEDWLSPYQPGRGSQSFFNYYLKQKPPYYPSHQFMQKVSEFRLLQGMTPSIYQALLPYITVLPDSPTPININTASKPVLMALGNGLNENQVDELIEARGEKGIQDLNRISLLLQKLNIRHEDITVESQYFMSVAKITMEDLHLTTYAILKRSKDKNGKISVSLISQSRNSFE
ncbi:type II secretion system minor pseudopilin GspK [Legionella fairfieldensis]|uniref:type II secretion system minor pseudopilin GspK n=1 Tax=Legionella fairfieldensis TaxID=45064 RepID=UPI00048C0ADF|nr:type II secretion system minor pseudopilin GspK [Legionella fairfieldensis]